MAGLMVAMQFVDKIAGNAFDFHLYLLQLGREHFDNLIPGAVFFFAVVKQRVDNDMVVLPDDLVFDTTAENFTVKFQELDEGEHIIAVRIKDDIGNTTYKTFAIHVSD